MIDPLLTWASIFSLVFPLYHLVELTRFLCIGAMESRPRLNLGYLLLSPWCSATWPWGP
ncbi:MAG: hypothetical protein AB1461_00750 [Thermodesulfobacteriota bacterium]